MKLSGIQLYYLSTPLFVVADLGFGLRFRVAETLDGQSRYVYYGACLALGLLCLALPKLQSLFALLESSANILLLALSVMHIDYDAAIDGGNYQPPLDLSWQSLLTFFSTAVIWILFFKRAERGLFEDGR